MTDDHDDFTLPYGLGGLPSPPDPNDFPAELDSALTLPVRFLLRGIPPVLNQHDLPECGGYSAAGIKTVQEKADQHGWLAFDPHWIYRIAQIYDGVPMPHVGTTARGVCKALMKVGPRITGKPGTEALHRIASYEAVPWTYDAIKRSIWQYRTPVLIGAAWYRSWFEPKRGVMGAPDVQAGGHLLWAWAWDDKIEGGSLLLQNSWGVYPGSVNGRVYAPAKWFVPAIHDAWRLNDIRGD